ncbi:MAG: DnaJ C-terminal domain-containing protein [Vicinamibacterales bacterium]
MDLYVVLGVRREASAEDIRRAYKRLARRYHPDINPGDREAAARFRDILSAYETLVDPERRRRYDHGEASPPAPPSAGFTGFDFSPRVHAERTTTFGDLFAGVFVPPAAAGRPARGADIHASITLALADVMQASRQTLTWTREVPCLVCAGAGTSRAPAERCVACDGSGMAPAVRGHMVFTTACGSCGGSGRQPAARCPACDGRGTGPRTEPLAIDVPAGVADGAVIRLSGLGHAGRGGGPPGDLHVAIAVAPHPLFRRDGNDLHLDVPLALHEAALGTRVPLRLLDGSIVRLRVPPGTQSGQRFRLRERGVPSPRDGRRGDIVAEVRLMLPRVLDERAKELLREFGRTQSESVRDGRFPADGGA